MDRGGDRRGLKWKRKERVFERLYLLTTSKLTFANCCVCCVFCLMCFFVFVFLFCVFWLGRHNVFAVHAALTRFAKGDFLDGKADFAWALQVRDWTGLLVPLMVDG